MAEEYYGQLIDGQLLRAESFIATSAPVIS